MTKDTLLATLVAGAPAAARVGVPAIADGHGMRERGNGGRGHGVDAHGVGAHGKGGRGRGKGRDQKGP